MKKNVLIGIAVAVAAIVFIGLGVQRKFSSKPLRELPFYGPKLDTTAAKQGKFYQIPAFSFTDQDNATITNASVADKIFVADYFFSTCTGICPIMTKQMGRVAETFANDADVMFLSHSVNPEYDNSAILKAYAAGQGANTKQWKFLTGDKNALYKMGREGYFIDYASNAGGNSEAFLHTENFVLVDKQGHIRGYYDGTDSTSVDELIRDIKLLKQYYAWKN